MDDLIKQLVGLNIRAGQLKSEIIKQLIEADIDRETAELIYTDMYNRINPYAKITKQ